MKSDVWGREQEGVPDRTEGPAYGLHLGTHERPEMGSSVRTLPLPISEWRAWVASERSPRAVGTEKLVPWEEEQDRREPEVIQWRAVVLTQSSRMSIKGGGTSEAR